MRRQWYSVSVVGILNSRRPGGSRTAAVVAAAALLIVLSLAVPSLASNAHTAQLGPSSAAVQVVPGATYTGKFTSQIGDQTFGGGITLQWGTKVALPPDTPISFTVSRDGSAISAVRVPNAIRGVYVGYGPGSSAYCEFYFSEPVPFGSTIANEAFSRNLATGGNVWVSFAGSFSGTRDAEGTLRVASNTSSDPIRDECTSGYIPWTATSTTVPKARIARIGRVTVTGPKQVKKGGKATYRVRITNSGNDDARIVRIRLKGRGVVSPGRTIPWIAPRRTSTAKVKLKFREPGKVRVSFKVTSKNAGGKTVKKTIRVRK